MIGHKAALHCSGFIPIVLQICSYDTYLFWAIEQVYGYPVPSSAMQ